jgi:hypothetical protein
VLRPTDAESRQRIVMVHSAPITPTANRSIISAFINEGTDASIINLTPRATCSVSDLKTSRNDIRKPLIRGTAHSPSIRPNFACQNHAGHQAAANAGNMRRFAPRRPDHARDIPLPFFIYSPACSASLPSVVSGTASANR